MPNPPVNEKTLIDIDVSKGLNEAMAQENVDWTKGLVVLDNLVTEGGDLRVRDGNLSLGSATSPVRRIGMTKTGLAVVGGLEVFGRNENGLAAAFQSHGRYPEFSVENIQSGGEVTSSANITQPIGVVKSLYYIVSGYITYFGTTSVVNLDFFDRNSRQLIRRLKYSNGIGTNVNGCMQIVNGRYLFIFIKENSAAPVYSWIDLDGTIPDNVNTNITFTGSLTGLTSSSQIVGTCATSTDCYLLTNASGNCRVHKFTGSSGSSSANTTLTGFSEVGGIDTDGTSIFIAGVAAGVEGIAWSLWERASYAGSPWAGTASAGSSGSKSLANAVNAPGTGVTLNGLTVADFDGTNDYLGATNNGIGAGGPGTIAMLVNLDAVGATGADYYSDVGFHDSSGFVGMSFSSTNGAQAYVYDGAYKRRNVAMATGGWHLVIMRWDGSNLKLRVDSGSDVSTACGNVSASTAVSGNLGVDYAVGTFMNGKVAELLVSQVAITDAECTLLKSYVNLRYGLAL